MTTKLPPNSLILLFATPWDDDLGDRIGAVYGDVFADDLVIVGDQFVLDSRVTWSREEPLSDLLDAARGSQPPFAETELLALDAQTAAWKLSIASSKTSDIESMRRLAVCFASAGSLALFVPSTMRLFPPSIVKQVASNPEPNAAVQLLVHAWHNESFMRTRGLTAFGFPEVETDLERGLNAAFFDLMDVATAMIEANRPFRESERLTIGQSLFEVRPGTIEPDPQSPVSGTFGVIRI